MVARRSGLWRPFVLGRALVAVAMVVLLLILNGLPPRREVWPLLGLLLLQLAANGVMSLAGRREASAALAWLACCGDIVLITLLIWLLRPDGWTFMLAYSWPIVVGGLIVGRQAIPVLTLWTGLCSALLLAAQKSAWAPAVRLLAPDGTPQVLVLAYPYLVFMALLVWLIVREVETSREELAYRNLELKQERNRLSAILAHMREAVLVTDDSGLMLQANPAAREVLGAAAGRSAPAWLAEAASRADGSRRMIEREGRTLRIEAVPLPSGADPGGATLYVATDVTEAVHLERLRTEFVSYASHELRTPLTTIRTLVRLMQRDAAQDAQASERLAMIESQVARQAHLANTLLDYARLQADTYDLALEPVDARLVVEESLAALRTMAAEKGVSLHVLCEEGLPRYAWNASALEQVVVNLVTNAIGFTDAGGRVAVSLRRVGDQVLLEVDDTGIGMTPHQVALAFHRFHTTRKQQGRGEGAGLGLMICRMIAQALGGSIGVESTPGTGSRFTLRLPARVAESAGDGDARTDLSAGAQGETQSPSAAARS